MRYGGIVLAYHGCDHDVAESVLAGKEELVLSQNKFDWLGSGAYFWENSATRALHWAKFLRDNPLPGLAKIKTPAAIGAVIAPGNCLDLSEAASLAILRDAYPNFVEVCKTAGIPVPKNEPGYHGDIDLVKRNLDCAVINYLHTTRGPRTNLTSIRFGAHFRRARKCIRARRFAHEHICNGACAGQRKA